MDFLLGVMVGGNWQLIVSLKFRIKRMDNPIGVK